MCFVRYNPIPYGYTQHARNMMMQQHQARNIGGGLGLQLGPFGAGLGGGLGYNGLNFGGGLGFKNYQNYGTPIHYSQYYRSVHIAACIRWLKSIHS